MNHDHDTHVINGWLAELSLGARIRRRADRPSFTSPRLAGGTLTGEFIGTGGGGTAQLVEQRVQRGRILGHARGTL